MRPPDRYRQDPLWLAASLYCLTVFAAVCFGLAIGTILRILGA